MRHFVPYFGNWLLLLFGSFFLLLPTPVSPCWRTPENLEIEHFVIPTLLRAAPSASYLFLNYSEMYQAYGGEVFFRDRSNAEEWQDRYCGIPDLEDIEWLLYKSSANQIEFLSTAVRREDIPLNQSLRNNTFARYLEKHQCLETVDYLSFAKSCEKHVLAPEDPWARKKRNISEMEALINRGIDLLPRQKSHYIRLRYLYQMIRLAHYSGNYQLALDMYRKFMPMIDNDPSQLEYWILGHLAGCLQANGENAHATFFYSRVFSECPGKRQSALLSYRVRSDSEWQKSLLLARNSREKANMYAMRAFGRKAKRVEEMKSIYALDPTNPFLELLLEKEIRELELLLERELPIQKYSQRYLANLGDRAISLLRLVSLWSAENKVKRPEVWAMAKGYLEVLTGDYYAAGESFARIKGGIRDKALRDQLEIFELVGTIGSWKEPAPPVELQADSIQKYHRQYAEHEDVFYDLLYGKMAKLYRENGEPGKAFLCQYKPRDLFGNPTPEVVSQLLALARKDNINIWERDLLSIPEAPDFSRQLILLEVMNYIKNGELEIAQETLKQINLADWDSYGQEDPFGNQIKDCITCPVDTARQINRGEWIAELLRLEFDSKANPDHAASNFFRIGRAYYNTTYFGPAWEMLDRFRSSFSIRQQEHTGNYVYFHPDFARGNREIMDCSRAASYFRRSLELARDRNPELAAKAAFWAAKCEQNKYFLERHQGAPRTYKYFNILKNDFSTTQFYQEILQECKYFEAFDSR